MHPFPTSVSSLGYLSLLVLALCYRPAQAQPDCVHLTARIQDYGRSVSKFQETQPGSLPPTLSQVNLVSNDLDQYNGLYLSIFNSCSYDVEINIDSDGYDPPTHIIKSKKYEYYFLSDQHGYSGDYTSRLERLRSIKANYRYTRKLLDRDLKQLQNNLIGLYGSLGVIVDEDFRAGLQDIFDYDIIYSNCDRNPTTGDLENCTETGSTSSYGLTGSILQLAIANNILYSIEQLYKQRDAVLNRYQSQESTGYSVSIGNRYLPSLFTRPVGWISIAGDISFTGSTYEGFSEENILIGSSAKLIFAPIRLKHNYFIYAAAFTERILSTNIAPGGSDGFLSNVVVGYSNVGVGVGAMLAYTFDSGVSGVLFAETGAFKANPNVSLASGYNPSSEEINSYLNSGGTLGSFKTILLPYVEAGLQLGRDIQVGMSLSIRSYSFSQDLEESAPSGLMIPSRSSKLGVRFSLSYHFFR